MHRLILKKLLPPKAGFSGVFPKGFDPAEAAPKTLPPPPNILPDAVVALPTFKLPKFIALSPEVPKTQKNNI